MNIELAITYTQTFLPYHASFRSFRGHAHIWSGVPFQRTILYLIHMVQLSLEEHSPSQAHLFKKGNHPDVLFMVDNGEAIKVDDVKKIIDLVAHTSQSGTHYVLLENIERMTEEAANRLLKTLEEPSSNTYFLCTTEHPHQVLPTLTSRMSTHHIPVHCYSDQSIDHVIQHWNLPWQRETLRSILPQGEGLLYNMVEEFLQDQTHTYDILFSLQRVFHDITNTNIDFHMASSLLAFMYNKKERNRKDIDLFFFCFESYLSQHVVQYIEEQDTSMLKKIRRLQQGLSRYKADIHAHVHKKLATHHFICSSVLQHS